MHLIIRPKIYNTQQFKVTGHWDFLFFTVIVKLYSFKKDLVQVLSNESRRPRNYEGHPGKPSTKLYYKQKA